MDGYIRKTWDAAGSVIPADRASIEGVKTNPSRCLHSNACDYILELLSHAELTLDMSSSHRPIRLIDVMTTVAFNRTLPPT